MKMTLVVEKHQPQFCETEERGREIQDFISVIDCELMTEAWSW
jgi:hypothetical protein